MYQEVVHCSLAAGSALFWIVGAGVFFRWFDFLSDLTDWCRRRGNGDYQRAITKGHCNRKKGGLRQLTVR